MCKKIKNWYLYFLHDGDHSIVIHILYVHDTILVGNDDELIHWLKNELCQEFLGPLHYSSGLEVSQDKEQLLSTRVGKILGMEIYLEV